MFLAIAIFRLFKEEHPQPTSVCQCGTIHSKSMVIFRLSMQSHIQQERVILGWRKLQAEGMGSTTQLDFDEEISEICSVTWRGVKHSNRWSDMAILSSTWSVFRLSCFKLMVWIFFFACLKFCHWKIIKMSSLLHIDGLFASKLTLLWY